MDKKKIIYNKMRDRGKLECLVCKKIIHNGDPFTYVRTKQKSEYLIHDECFSKSH